MRKKGIFTRSPDGRLAPSDKRAHEIVAELETRAKALCWVHKARYVEHHRLAFAVLQKIGAAIGKPVEIVLLWIKHETGRFDWVRLPDGTTLESPHSIAFESMSQDEFQEFWRDALDVVKDKILPNIDDATFNELRDMIGGKVE